MKSLRKTWNLTVLWDQSAFWWPFLMALTLEPIKSLYNIYNAAGLLAWWSCSVTFRGCAIGSLRGSWSTIPHGRAVCGTLGGGCPEKSLPFHWSMQWAFLFWLSWCFKPPLESFKPYFSCSLWLTVWLLWTATDDTIGLFRSSSCSSERDIAHGRRVWCRSPLDLNIALELAHCYGFLLVE